MQTFTLVFIADDATWPDMETVIFEPSMHMADIYASKMLQRRSNTMFSEVHVCAQNDEGQVTEIRKIELIETRGTRQVES